MSDDLPKYLKASMVAITTPMVALVVWLIAGRIMEPTNLAYQTVVALLLVMVLYGLMSGVEARRSAKAAGNGRAMRRATVGVAINALWILAFATEIASGFAPAAST